MSLNSPLFRAHAFETLTIQTHFVPQSLNTNTNTAVILKINSDKKIHAIFVITFLLA